MGPLSSMPMVPGTVRLLSCFRRGLGEPAWCHHLATAITSTSYRSSTSFVVKFSQVPVGWHVSELGHRSVEPSPPEGALPRLLKGGNDHLLEAVGEWRRACRSRRLAAGEEPSAPAPPADLGRREPLQPRSTPNANGRGRSGQAGRSHASTTSEAICLQRLFELVVRSTRLLRASTGLASSAADLAASAPPLLRGFAIGPVGCRWALWLGWGRGFSSSAAGFRQLVEFFEVY